MNKKFVYQVGNNTKVMHNIRYGPYYERECNTNSCYMLQK